jgi:protein-tyrosine phosphatase
MGRVKQVLFVCLGNICRSPAAEGVFLHQLCRAGVQDEFVVDSAGTGDWHVGRPADPRMHAAAARRGVDLTSRARQIHPGDLVQFDHILTMDAANLTAVQALVRVAQRQGLETRAKVEPLVRYCRVSTAREVPDPYYGGPDGFEAVLDLLEDACDGLMQTLMRG